MRQGADRTALFRDAGVYPRTQLRKELFPGVPSGVVARDELVDHRRGKGRNPHGCSGEVGSIAHIPDGVLSVPVLAAGAAVTAGALALALSRLDYERIPQAAVLAATFFVVSVIHVPLGPGSVHLLLNGLMGLVLGWSAVPAILVGLMLQAAFFGYGGLIVLGVNTMNLVLPALACSALFGAAVCRTRGRRQFWLGAAAGALGVFLTAVLMSVSLALSGRELMPAAQVILAAYLPLILAEAAVTGAVIAFLGRVAPEVLSLQPSGVQPE